MDEQDEFMTDYHDILLDDQILYEETDAAKEAYEEAREEESPDTPWYRLRYEGLRLLIEIRLNDIAREAPDGTN